MLAATVATLSSASKRPAPSSASPSGTILAQGSQSQPPQRSHTCQNSSPRAPVRPDPATGFAPLTFLPEIVYKGLASDCDAPPCGTAATAHRYATLAVSAHQI